MSSDVRAQLRPQFVRLEEQVVAMDDDSGTRDMADMIQSVHSSLC